MLERHREKSVTRNNCVSRKNKRNNVGSKMIGRRTLAIENNTRIIVSAGAMQTNMPLSRTKKKMTVKYGISYPSSNYNCSSRK